MKDAWIFGKLRACALLVAASAVLFTGCDGVLDVEDKGVITEEGLERPGAIGLVVGRAFGDFAGAFNGDGGQSGARRIGFIVATGLLADEYMDAGSWAPKLTIDARRVTEVNSDVAFLYSNIHKARVSAEYAAAALEASGSSDEARRAELLSMSAYTYVFLAEAFCSGVPFSEVENGALVFGEPKTTTEVLEIAVARFQQALDVATAASSSEQMNFARVGLGRALLDLGRFEEAAQAVAAVPSSFELLLELSGVGDRQMNEPWSLTVWNPRLSVASNKGGNGIDYHNNADPRLPGAWLGRAGFDRTTQVYSQHKYPSVSSALPVADGLEARLIEAEVALRSGARAEFFSIHNALRASVGLEPLTDSGQSDSELVDLHFTERGIWLWTTGHRLSDMRRLVRQYGRSADDVFASGTYFKGGEYGTSVVFPVPFDERNNPNFTGCIDQSA